MQGMACAHDHDRGRPAVTAERQCLVLVVSMIGMLQNDTRRFEHFLALHATASMLLATFGSRTRKGILEIEAKRMITYMIILRSYANRSVS